MEKQNKTKTIRIRVTEKEYDLLVNLSSKNKLSISEYMLNKSIVAQLEIFEIPKKTSPIEKAISNMQNVSMKDITDLHFAGVGLEIIAKGLNDKGFRTKKGLLFTSNNLSKMLQREKLAKENSKVK